MANSTRHAVASGIYMYRLTSSTGFTETKRLTLLKQCQKLQQGLRKVGHLEQDSVYCSHKSIPALEVEIVC